MIFALVVVGVVAYFLGSLYRAIGLVMIIVIGGFFFRTFDTWELTLVAGLIIALLARNYADRKQS